MRTLLIKNAKNIITMDEKRTEYPGGSMYVVGQEIKAIGYDLPFETADTVIDARGKIVYPGLINTHHHLYQTFTRNIPWVQNVELFDWLITLYDIWRHLKPEDVYLSAMVGLGELLKSGCTTTADHFYVFPNGVSGELIDEEIRAAREIGIRFYPTRGSMSLGRSKGGLPPDEVVQSEDVILRDSMRVIETYHDPSKFSMLRVGVAPCSPFSVSKDLLRESANLARSYGVRMHTHLAETIDEEDFCREKLGMRPLELMEETGWVGGDVWYAHGIWFNDKEIAKLGVCGCGVAHCPSSNMKMASGTMRIMDMLHAGVKVGFGVDGSSSNDSSNLLLDLKIMNLLHNLQHGTTALSAEDCLSIATRGSSKVLGWEDAIGSLEVGKAADMFLIDTNRLEFAGALFNDTALPILAGTPQVDMTIVGGKIVVDEGRLVNIDEEQFAIRAQKAAEKMLETAAKHTKVNYRKSRLTNSAILTK
ncbi:MULTISPECIES: 8-oxoguanine deaminase [Anoxybacillaceae]|uniref:Cytosine/adenosine deaminase-related metal-dependent hydrolase n=1 Tax=Anoxybacteroides tepidamans TaxID=265948 RepID=A0A7W8MX27_9BACL|nr:MULTISPECIES: 8-oxoguanine deaminase [Bacillaceae]KZE92691.1 8-oxoguanine deaminase [Geobacillus stearothermophilus]MED4923465.1 8-oxoguanine deaminase [Anoxybacillus geothermalis]AGE22677.1 hydroxydechloroatrazine ethylaminohydrolase [Geobacillus sp. GHH01]AMQ20900.1 hydroxydechloroatrazine ethylaminohydrolase [Geobacillus sp. JS12]MBB5325976.1 cytosine/adenosine deaminase-related metal-dependent hydrolase [Anoxybacillus tepidamans]